ncbi:bifunctional diguanylate cyclase/phosphodiesterase [Rhodobacterales bacterium]|nr:bifunctional diguanylate cyclase/phosphodiesterase [Rhodobacterales bacterium]
MDIRRWLKGLVFFLLAPCLLFASLWFYNEFEKVHSIDRSLEGLHLMQALGPLVQEKALTGVVEKPATYLRKRLIAFGGPKRGQEFARDLDMLLKEQNISVSLRRAQFLTESITRFAKVSAAASFETSKFPHLINNTLLSVVIESTIMVDNARMLSDRPTINPWDRMLIPVQGGQFKVAADSAARETRDYFKSLTGKKAGTLREVSRHYRESNLTFQLAGAQLLSTTISAKTGGDIEGDALIAAQPDLVRSAFVLWQSAVDYLDADLHDQRTRTVFAVALAGLVGGVVILAAGVIAFLISRDLANRTQKEFEYLGFHDPLTGLPNRRALTKAIRTLPAADESTRTGLLLLDLRHFKNINDRFGDHNGDAILRCVSEQLSEFSDPNDFLGRTGGTEFILLRPGLSDQEAFLDLADRIIHNLGKDRYVLGQKAALEANAGIYISAPGDLVDEHILVDAGLALRSAKKRGAGKVDLFTSEMRISFEKSSTIAKGLLKALREGDIKPWFQPQIDIFTGEVVGAEALVRWIDHGRVRYPGMFLQAAIEAGYMDLIDSTVREKTLNLASQLNGQTRRRMHLGLNTSASFLANADSVETLVRQVEQRGLKPSDISLEILEAVMIDEVAAEPVKRNITRLSELGFFIELDDFGTGHSSISSLRDLKVDRVKIDRSFVSGVDTNPDLQKFTSALINLAKSLDIAVLAEGVETDGELEWLKAHGCDVIQGFLISKALPVDELTALILRRNFSSTAVISPPMLALSKRS